MVIEKSENSGHPEKLVQLWEADSVHVRNYVRRMEMSLTKLALRSVELWNPDILSK